MLMTVKFGFNVGRGPAAVVKVTAVLHAEVYRYSCPERSRRSSCQASNPSRSPFLKPKRSPSCLDLGQSPQDRTPLLSRWPGYLSSKKPWRWYMRELELHARKARHMQNTGPQSLNTWKAIKLVPGGPEETVSPKGPTNQSQSPSTRNLGLSRSHAHCLPHRRFAVSV